MKKYALIIGVSRYDDPEIGNLNFAADDALEVGACLREVCGFDEVRTLVTGGEKEPDHISVVKALHSFAPILNEDDLFLFYFAGHGIHTANGSYLLASNSLIRMPELAAVPMPLLQQCLSRLDAAERVLILDACRNDPHQGRGDSDNILTPEFSRDILAVAKTPCEGVSPATCVLFSCSEGERAYEWPDKQHGAFTWYLLDGMRGAALDPQGRLTIQGLSRYVEEHVPRWSRKTGLPRAQTPWAQQLGSLREICLTVTSRGMNSGRTPRAGASQKQKSKTSGMSTLYVPPQPQETLWYVSVDGLPSAGMSLASLREEFEVGKRERETLVWSAELVQWTPAYKVAAFIDAFPSINGVPPSNVETIPHAINEEDGSRFRQAATDANRMAKKSLLFALVGLLPWMFFLGIPAIICGYTARARFVEVAEDDSARGLALAGITLGYVEIAFGSLTILLTAF